MLSRRVSLLTAAVDGDVGRHLTGDICKQINDKQMVSGSSCMAIHQTAPWHGPIQTLFCLLRSIFPCDLFFTFFAEAVGCLP